MTQKLVSLLYVSQAAHPMPGGKRSIDDIVATSLVRNAALGVTGALVYTGPHFAQLLEGTSEAVETLMASIKIDSRHSNVQVLEIRTIAERCFADWRLAYAGPSLFVDRHISPLVEKEMGGNHHAQMAQRLVGLMQEFASGRKSPLR